MASPIPDGWNGWSITGLGGFGGSGPICGNWCSGNTGGAQVNDDEWIMVHAVDASTLDGDVRLCFDVGDNWADWNEWIHVSFDAGTGWQEAWYWENELGADGTCRRVCLNLSDIDPDVDNNPNLLIRFWLSSNTWNERMFIDDIEVDGAVYCTASPNVSLTSIVDVGSGNYTFDIVDDAGVPLAAWVTCSWDTPPVPVSDRDWTWFQSP
jgi:hypothetical protein